MVLLFIYFFLKKNSDELAGFEEAWKGNNIDQSRGWKGGYDVHRSQSKSFFFFPLD